MENTEERGFREVNHCGPDSDVTLREAAPWTLWADAHIDEARTPSTFCSTEGPAGHTGTHLGATSRQTSRCWLLWSLVSASSPFPGKPLPLGTQSHVASVFAHIVASSQLRLGSSSVHPDHPCASLMGSPRHLTPLPRLVLNPGSIPSTEPGMVALTCRPSAWEAEAGGSRVQGHPERRSETLSPKNPQF